MMLYKVKNLNLGILLFKILQKYFKTNKKHEQLGRWTIFDAFSLTFFLSISALLQKFRLDKQIKRFDPEVLKRFKAILLAIWCW